MIFNIINVFANAFTVWLCHRIILPAYWWLPLLVGYVCAAVAFLEARRGWVNWRRYRQTKNKIYLYL